jgi:hypothetical protein
MPWLVPVEAVAQSPFDGTWRIDPESQRFSAKPDIYLLKEGRYQCITCDPQLDLPADGADHPITGEPCYDTVSVRVVNDHTTEETDKRNGKTVGTTRIIVSPDGKTATTEWMETCNANDDISSGKDILSRVTKGPRGSHAISGSWRTLKRWNQSENALVVTLKLEDETFSFADPTGQSYVARLDGTETPIKGDLSNTMVSVRRIGVNTIQETDKHNGKIVEVVCFTVWADRKTISVSMENRMKRATTRFVLRKQ